MATYSANNPYKNNPQYAWESMLWEQNERKKKAEADKQNQANQNTLDLQAQYQAAIDNLTQQQSDFQNRVLGFEDASGRRFEQSSIKYDAQGRPIVQDFESIRNADGGLSDKYKLEGGPDVTANRDALDQMREIGLSEGDSPWAMMMKQQQAAEQAQAMDQANRGTANQLTQGQNLLAQSGGLNGAGRTSLARQAMRQGAAAQQGVNRQGVLDRLDIGVKDQEMKTNMLNQIQQGEMGMANLDMQNRAYNTQIDQTNLSNQLKDLEQKRMYDANNYTQAMQGWAANKSADAQAKAGSGGKK